MMRTVAIVRPLSRFMTLRRWSITPVWTAIGGLLLVASLTSCGEPTNDGGTTTTAEPTMTTTVPGPSPTTVMPASSSTTTTTSVTTTTPAAALPPLLVADRNGVRVIEDGAVVTSFIEDVAVDVARPDLTGGIVYQETMTGAWHWAWNEALDQIVIDITGGSGPPAIMSLSHPGGNPAVIVESDDAIPTLLQVVRLEGRPAVLYSSTTAEARAGCGLEECVVRELMLQWLDTREQLDLGTLAAFESSVVRFELGDDLMVVITQSYGEQDVCGAVWHRDELFEIGGPGIWIGGGGPFWRRCEFGSQVGGSDSGCQNDCMSWLEAAIAPDGQTIAYLELPVGVAPAASLVVIDAETGVQLRQVSIAGPAFPMISSIDWDGSYAVIRRGSSAGPVIVLPDGAIHGLDTKWATLWTES